MFLINIQKRISLFLLREILLFFVSNILKNKNLGNKQIVIQEETISFSKEIDFYTQLLFLINLKLKKVFNFLVSTKVRILILFSICLKLSKTFINKVLSKNKQSSKTNNV